MKKKIRLLLVDDHPLVLAGIRSHLGRRRGIRIVGQALTGKEAIQKAKSTSPDVILLDIGLPDINGGSLMEKITNEVPCAKVLIYTVHDEKEYILEFLRLGASGYVLKGSQPSELTRAITAVRDDRIFLGSQIGKILKVAACPWTHALGTDGLPFEPLTKKGVFSRVTTTGYCLTRREKEILSYVVEGLTTHEIGAQLSISYDTVTCHLKHLYTKLQVHNRAAAVAKTLREDLL